MKPERWKDPANKLFPHQVAFTAPPHDFDAAPSDFLRICQSTRCLADHNVLQGPCVELSFNRSKF